MINIVFVTDRKYYLPALVTLKSVMNSTNEKVNARVIGDFKLDKKEKSILEEMIVFYPNLQVKYLDFDINKFEGVKTKNHVSLAAYIKILLPEILSDFEKVIYLDSDLFVVEDIKNLWETSSDGATILAVKSANYYQDNKVLGIEENQETFNSGVMVLDLCRMRENKDTKILMEFIREKNHLTKLNDQAAFNFLYKGQWKKLDPTWNVYAQYFLVSPSYMGYPRNIFKKIRRSPKIIHFNGPMKPWNYENIHPYKKNYFQFYSSITGIDKYVNKTRFPYFYKLMEIIKYVRGAIRALFF